MKKLILGAALAMGTLTYAQQFGIKAGLNVSSISDEGFDDTNSKAGFYAGVLMNAPIAENFSIQPEVIYNNLGAKYTTSIGSSTSETKLNLDYITVPVMFQYNATPSFYLEAGPEFGFLVNAKADTDINTPIGSGSSSTDLDTDDFNKFNFGVGIGAGFNFTQNFGLNARYVAGFSDITDVNSDPSTDANNKNNVFQVGLTYKF